jgi:hypothetical protein
MHFRFYKKGCQEKYFSHELKPEKISASSPSLCTGSLWRGAACLVPVRDDHKFPSLPFPLIRGFSAERPGAVKGAPFSARRREPFTARTVLRRSTGRERKGADSIRFL